MKKITYLLSAILTLSLLVAFNNTNNEDKINNKVLDIKNETETISNNENIEKEPISNEVEITDNEVIEEPKQELEVEIQETKEEVKEEVKKENNTVNNNVNTNNNKNEGTVTKNPTSTNSNTNSNSNNNNTVTNNTTTNKTPENNKTSNSKTPEYKVNVTHDSYSFKVFYNGKWQTTYTGSW